MSRPLPPILECNADLTSGNILDVDGNPVDQPKADLLFMGIVCVDISRCSSTPKPLTDPKGISGTCWLDFIAYLKMLNFQDLPKAIILECVDNLDLKHSISGMPEKGTEVVADTLWEQGYVGEWLKLLATNFCSPQQGPRVWGLFLNICDGMGPKALESRRKDLNDLTEALDIQKLAM